MRRRLAVVATDALLPSTVHRAAHGARSSSSTAAGSAAEAGAWWAAEGGLSFACTQCGRCCTGNHAHRAVAVSDEEAAALAAATGLSAERFAEQHLRRVAGRLALQHREGRCTFLQGRRCAVHAQRPAQCRTYPFWPEAVQSQHHWAAEAVRCEGISLPHAAPSSAARPGLTPHAEVLLNMVIDDVHRNGGGTTYDETRSLLGDVDSELLAEYAADFFGTRSTRAVYESPALLVLDLLSPEAHLRSLVFKSSADLHQSAVPLDAGGALRHDVLQLEVHRALAAALAALPPAAAAAPRVAVVGGGGCALPLALMRALPAGATVDVAEPDAEVLAVARRFFGVREALQRHSGALRLHAVGGEEMLAAAAPASFDVVLVDAAAAPGATAAPSVGAAPWDGDAELLAPPPPLATAAFLRVVRGALASGGVVAFNVMGGHAAERRFEAAAAAELGGETAALDLSSATALFVRPGGGVAAGGAGAAWWEAALQAGLARRRRPHAAPGAEVAPPALQPGYNLAALAGRVHVGRRLRDVSVYGPTPAAN